LQQGSNLNAALRIFNSQGTQVSLFNISRSDPVLSYLAPSSGTYFVGVSSVGDVSYDPLTGGNHRNGGSTGMYSLSVNDLLARFVIASPLGNGDQVVQGTLTAGQPQDYRLVVADTPLLLAG